MANNGQLEPYMIRGLELLRSNDPNALNEMFKHFEEACKEHYGENRRPTNAAKNMTVPAALFASVERLKLSAEDGPSTSGASSVPAGGTTSENAAEDEIIVISSDSDSEKGVDCMTSKCVVCKTSDMTEGNVLVECLECLASFHQNCLVPPLRDVNLSDPRHVWYCLNCNPRQQIIKPEPNLLAMNSKASSSKKATGSATKTMSESAKGAGSSGSSSASSSVKQQPTSSKMSALKKKAKVADTKVAKRRYVRKKDKKM